MKYLIGLYFLSLFSFMSYMYQGKTLEESIADGTEIYQDFCVQCHLDNGKGVDKAFPPLANSDYLKNVEQSIRAIKYGLEGEITVNGEIYNGVMTSQGLDDEEIADVMNYILNSWGNKADKQVTINEVSETLN